MQGLDIYKTKEGFTVAKLHYSADPDKILPNGEPIPELLEGYVGGKGGAAWRKEMEIDFTAYSGQLLCYDILVNYKHKIVRHYEIKPHYYKFGSLDWGRNNPCSFHEYIVGALPGGGVHIHSNFEIYRNDMSIPEFSSRIKNAPHYKEYTWISADPSLWNKNQEDAEGVHSLEDRFRAEDITLRKGKSRDDEIAIEELLTRWGHLDIFDATFTISTACPKQIWEFERLRYKEITTAMVEKSNPNEQLVDKDNHSWDDFKYFITTYLQTPRDESAIPPKKHTVAWFMNQYQESLNNPDFRSKYK
uniref:Terminase n=3 Tax=viral metagenome TaxID=1070528 RepID=A0A6M3KPJ7_9ZZZZ